MVVRSWWSRAASAAAAVAALAGCGGASGSETRPEEVGPVLLGAENLFVAETRTVETGPAVSGTLVADREATVRAEVGGTVIQVAVEAGQPVGRGTLLGRISDDAIRDQVQSARSAARTASEALAVARRNAERSERLAAAGALAERDLEQARWSATNAEAALAEANARIAAAEKQWSYTQLRSPIGGVVSERHVRAGDVVSAGNPLFTVVDPTSLKLEAQVPVATIEALRVGTRVPFTVDGLGDRVFEGRIARINPAVDPMTRQVRITVTLPNHSGRLVAGLFAQGRAATESRTGVAVPLSAIDRSGLRPVVTRIRNGMTERVEVATGIEDASTDRVEVVAGLAAGDTVVIGSARGLQPGTRVQPAAAAERRTAAQR